MEEDAYVPRLDELIPDAEVLLALEPEELAGAILEVLIVVGLVAAIIGWSSRS